MNPSNLPRSDVLPQGPPWFMAYTLFDGDSLRFGEFMYQRMNVLDGAWGRSIHGIRIGDPREAGRLYERLRTPQRASRDREAAKKYRQHISQRGSSQHHILRETQVLTERLGVAKQSLPALAFRTNPPASNLPILHVESTWLESAEDALSHALQEFLSEESIERLAKSSDGTIGLCSGLQRILNEITVQLREVDMGLKPGPQVPMIQESLEKLADQFTVLVATSVSRAFYRGRELHLSSLPFHLNRLLVRTAQQGSGWVSRDALESYLWPDEVSSDNPPSPRRLDDAMRRLRASYLQIEGVTNEEVRNLFLTKRKVGFRLDLPADRIHLV